MLDPTSPFTAQNLDRIRDASHALAMQSADLVGNDPHAALMALVLAAGHLGAVVCKLAPQDLVKLVTDHVEYALIQEAERELGEAGEPVVMLPKPELKV